MTKRRAAWAAHEKHYFFGVKSRKQGEYLAASKIASAMLTAPAVPVPAMSNAVPWSTDVLRIGIPLVMAMVRSKSSVFAAMCPWS